ncbi:hypothetical protein SAMN05192588_2296 [Nonlabens sp. Hel1_33_55]|uniref:hypothetical protein n=1 Tax=Nonlabens sp. Hel1_33_55 TaxID=1336802 RepID=UPI000875CE96|nr:hypothetical protein [Nonlabens sp. Hel1_33_55]SCY32957.1 hypothetical protein SAMN05192588_2296 [Nonlabens sp. Hel1_33_55]
MNIVTSICVDVATINQITTSKSPQIKNKKDHRSIYWKCVTAFCLTSLRCNSNLSHLVFTNDAHEVIIDGINIKTLLESKGVNIISLPFLNYDPKENSNYFRNAFYKLEVIEALGKLENPSLLLDSDCIWTRPASDVYKLITQDDKVVLMDIYQRSNTPFIKEPHDLSMEDMKQIYDQIKVSNLTCKRDFPIWYGGEIIGAQPYIFKEISEKIRLVFDFCLEQAQSGNPLVFANGRTVFDGDELITSHVFNCMDDHDIYDAFAKAIKRIWNGIGHNNVEDEDLNLPIWHLPAAKENGLKRIFEELVQPHSPFYELNTDPALFLGRFVGIPYNNLSSRSKLERQLKIWLRKLVR